MNLREAIAKIVNREHLTDLEMRAVFGEIMSGDASAAQIGAFLTALRMKGETIDEIVGATRAMRERANFLAFKDYDEPGAGVETGTDSHVSRAVLNKEGTVILEARVNKVPYVPSPKMKMLYWGYSKQILNAKADGLSTKPAGGDEVFEIVPMSEVAKFSAGKTTCLLTNLQ